MQRYNISLHEAEEKVRIAKLKKVTNLEGFIYRYGLEEGTRKFEDFKNKSAQTLEKFIQRYGDIEGAIKWQTYLKSKNSRSLEKLIERYGEEEGKLRFETINKNYKYKMSEQYYIDTYGIDEGKLKYNELIKSMDSSTYDFFVKKYGENAKDEYIKRCLQKDSASKEFFIRKYGYDKGIELFNAKCMHVSPIFNKLLEKYTYDEAVLKYQLYKEQNNIENGSNVSLKNRVKLKSTGPVSKISNIFFNELEEKLGYKLVYGSRKLEFSLFDEDNYKVYYYDCLDLTTNTIIEFNGSLFHANPSLSESEAKTWTTLYGKSYIESLTYDANKINFALKNNFRVLVVWDYEISNKNKMYNKINEIKGLLQNESNKSNK